MPSYLSFLFLLVVVDIVCAALGGNWNKYGDGYDAEVHYFDTVGPGSRAYAHTWVDADSNFWLFGGIGFVDNCTSSGLVIYDDMWKRPPSGDWVLVQATIPLGPRAAGLTWIFMNELYLYGGETNLTAYGNTNSGEFDKPQALGHLYKYIISNSSWVQVVDGTLLPDNGHPGARLGAAAWSVGTKLYLFGGMTSTTDLKIDFWAFDTQNPSGGWVFNGTFGDKSQTNCGNSTSYPMCVYGAAVTVVANVLYLAGGRPHVGNLSAEVWKCDLTSGWHQSGTLNAWTYWANGFSSSSTFYVYGGLNGGSMGIIQMVDIASGSTTTVDLSSSMGTRFGAQVLEHFIYGGISMAQFGVPVYYSDLVEIVNAESGIVHLFSKKYKWQQLPLQKIAPSVPDARIFAMTWTDNNGDLWLHGGRAAFTCTNSNLLTDTWHYSITQHSWNIVTESGPALSSAATWVDDNNELWMFGGDKSNFVVSPSLVCNVYHLNSNTWDDRGCPLGVSPRELPIVWKNRGSVYFYGGILAGSAQSKDLVVFTAGNWSIQGQYEPGPNTPATTWWDTQETVYMYLSNQNMMSWDKATNSGWNTVPITGTRADARSSPIAWTDGGGNLFMFQGTFTATDLSMWQFTVNSSQWTSQTLSDAPGVFNINANPVTYWQGAWLHVWGYQTNDPSLAMWLYDLCKVNSGGCQAGQICAHKANRCVNPSTVEPIHEFFFSNSLADEFNNSFVVSANPVNYIETACLVGMNTTSGTTTVPPVVWDGIDFDFSLGAKMSFTGPYSSQILFGDAPCGQIWNVTHQTNKVAFTYNGVVVLQILINLNVSEIFTILLTRSGSTFSLYVNDAPAFNSMPLYPPLTTGIHFGDCNQNQGALVLDDLALYDIPINTLLYNHSTCTVPTVRTELTDCGTLTSVTGTYYLSTNFTMHKSPCFIFSSSAGVIFDGQNFTISCAPELNGDCTAVQFIASTSPTLQNANIMGSVTVSSTTKYLVQNVMLSEANQAFVSLNSDGVLQESTFTPTHIGVLVENGNGVKIIGCNFTQGVYGIVLENVPFVDIENVIILDLQPVSGKVGINSFIAINSTGADKAQITITECQLSFGISGPVVSITGYDVSVTFTGNNISTISPGNSNSPFFVLSIQASSILTLNFNDNQLSNFAVACNPFSFVYLESGTRTGTGMFTSPSNLNSVTWTGHNCTTEGPIFEGIHVSNMALTLSTLEMRDIRASDMDGNAVQDVTVYRYLAGVALYNSASVNLVNAHFANFTAPKINPSTINFVPGYSAYAVVSVSGTTKVQFTGGSYESFHGGNAGLVTLYVGGVVTATGGNAALFSIVDSATADLDFQSVTYENFHDGDGKLPLVSQDSVYCSPGIDSLYIESNAITNFHSVGSSNGTSTQGANCSSPCNPACSVNAVCSLETQVCTCYPYFIASGAACNINSIPCATENTQLVGNGGFERTNPFAQGTLQNATEVGGCGNNTLKVTYSDSSSLIKLENVSLHIGKPANFSFWVRGENLLRPAVVSVNFLNTEQQTGLGIFLNVPTGTFGWNKQFKSVSPSFNVSHINISISSTSGILYFDNFALTDIVPCQLSCGTNQVCENVDDAPTCVCQSGFEMNILNECEDKDECANSTVPLCNAHASCINTIGSYNCSCNYGFKGDGFSTCQPQCLCGDYGNCTELHGDHYNCTCKQGFVEDNLVCVDFDECNTPAVYCNLSNSFCNNLFGNYTCGLCQPGFQGTFFNHCMDINECLFENGGCDPHVVCNNTSPWFNCPPCPPLFTGNSSTKCIPLCGDGYCNATLGETCVSCPHDCTNATCSQCGDGKCDPNESCTTCFDDCSSQCALKQCQDPTCSGHGTCHDGACFCTENWSGPTCKKNNAPVSVTTGNNSTDPNITVTATDSSFNIAIISVQELLLDGSILEQFPLLGNLRNFTKFTDQTENPSVWVFNTTLSNQAVVSIIIQYYAEASTATFANKTSDIAANTVKLNVRVKNWPFKAAQNSLAIIIDAASGEKQTQSCNINSNTNSNGSLTWFQLTINGRAMYGQFSPDAILDGRNRIVTFHLNADNGQITAVVPHFWDEMDLDPTFGVLLGSSSDNCGKHSHVNKTVYIAVFVTFGALLILGVALFFLFPKIKTFFKVHQHSMELQQIPSSGIDEYSPVIEKRGDMEVYTSAGRYVVPM